MSQNVDVSQNNNALQNITNVVVLMFENRSFDHLFGDFRNVNGLFTKHGGFKDECYNLTNPLKPPTADDGDNPKCFPMPVDPSKIMKHDFTHAFGDGMMPDMFGPVFTNTGTGDLEPTNTGAIYTSGYTKDGVVGCITPRPQTYPDTNSGFISTYNSCAHQGETAISYFEKGTLKILHQLADEFVLCDNWHCDMPGHTMPNRAFMHCGTTGGVEICDSDTGMVGATSIFDQINNYSTSTNPITWQMYAPIWVPKPGEGVPYHGVPYHLDLSYLNTNLANNYTGAPLTDFANDCQNGLLPFYSFIMCWLPNSTNYTDTSMHPNSLMQPGENLLAAVYNTLRNSPQWENTLLVVNFDENGGIYDHVFPPQTTPPQPDAQPYTTTPSSGNNDDACRNNWQLQSTFDFSLLGFRTPALLISPWLSKGVDSTQYQNTSVLRFVTDTMNANYETNAPYLTARDANAPSLNSAFSQFGLNTMRTDCPSRIEPYATLPCEDHSTHSNWIPYADGSLQPWTPPAGTSTAAPVVYINELLNMYVSSMLGHPDSGELITRSFATNAEVAEYVGERIQAAETYRRAATQNNKVMAEATAG